MNPVTVKRNNGVVGEALPLQWRRFRLGHQHHFELTVLYTRER